ncbi:MAG: AMP-binding protein [Alphaproteobacteria bacterium]|nr:AMP-binding protein [Alphaproteobacteria bacterium]
MQKINQCYSVALSNLDSYQYCYNISINNPCEFWDNQLDALSWKNKPTTSFNHAKNEWCPYGTSNICYNCVDRHALSSPFKVAIVWHGDNPGEREEITYIQLLNIVQNISYLLLKQGVKKGDVVCLYMPNHYLSVAAMLACARIGAVHMVVFSGFSSEVLKRRIIESKAKVVLTMDKCSRAGKTIELSEPVSKVCRLIVKNRPSLIVLHKNIVNNNKSSKTIPIEWLNNTDDGFLLYTSGTSGKSKGVVHAAIPYMLYVSSTFKNIFDCNKDDVVFCTSDIGWITGHSYSVYAPLFWGLKIVLFEGTPIYPDQNRYWNIIKQERVTIFYTAPTAIRSLQAYDFNFKTDDLSSLRILGSVGEPLNESAWKWYSEKIGNKHLPIMDTWWQTETGGIILAPIRNYKEQLPGVAGFPFFGVQVKINEKDNQLIITNNYPGKYKYILNVDPKKESIEYYTGDGAQYIPIIRKSLSKTTEYKAIKISGRIDDVINISGHRMSTSEFENAISKMDEIKETATIAIDHEVTGQAAVVFAVLKDGTIPQDTTELDNKIRQTIRERIGAIAKPHKIIYLEELPKTTTGKIERYKLRKQAQSIKKKKLKTKAKN